MPYCTRCGTLTDSGSGLCSSCSLASVHGTGTPDDVPCQRCGMYLPPHELRMWNSRLYCSYCIMDIQDDEQRGKREKKPEAEGAGSGGGKGPSGQGVPKDSRNVLGTCERCGRQAEVLYIRFGQRLCSQCNSQTGGEAGTGRASLFGQIVVRVKKALGIFPKVVEKKSQPPGKQDAGQMAQPSGQPPEAASEGHGQVFSIKGRQMEDRNAMAGQSPMGEGPDGEKKPAPKAKKFFFAMHPEEKGGGGKSSKK